MKVGELRELLADAPDYFEVGIEAVTSDWRVGERADRRTVIPIEGLSGKRWTHTLALLVKPDPELSRWRLA